MMNTISADVLILGLDDWINLPEVAGIVRSHLSSSDPTQLFPVSIALLRQLLSSGLVEVGDLTGEGGRFRPWDLDIDATIMEIERRWTKYGGPLDIDTGEFVCWLSNTQEGDRKARTFVLSQ